MTHFSDQFSDKFGLDRSETDSIINSLSNECILSSARDRGGLCDDLCDDKLDYIELFLAIALNAKVRGLTNDSRYKKLKLLINNNSKRAVNLGNRWIEGQISFVTMLSII